MVRSNSDRKVCPNGPKEAPRHQRILERGPIKIPNKPGSNLEESKRVDHLLDMVSDGLNVSILEATEQTTIAGIDDSLSGTTILGRNLLALKVSDFWHQLRPTTAEFGRGL